MHELREPAKLGHLKEALKSHHRPVKKNARENKSIIIHKCQAHYKRPYSFLEIMNANTAPLLTSMQLSTPPRRASFDKATRVVKTNVYRRPCHHHCRH
jgi:hypothetical protein